MPLAFLASLCETDSPGRGRWRTAPEGAVTPGPEGENCAIVRNISGCRKLLSPAAAAAAPAEGGQEDLPRTIARNRRITFMDKRNKNRSGLSACRCGGGGRAPAGRAGKCRHTGGLLLTVLALVGYLLLASKTRAAYRVRRGGACAGADPLRAARPAGRGHGLAPALRAADLWLFWGAALVLVRLAGRQQSKMPYIAAVPLAVYTVTHLYPVADLRRRRQLCGVQRRHALVCGHYDPRLQRRAHKKKRRFCANLFRDKVTNTANCVILNTIIKIQPEGRLYYDPF